MKKLLNIFQLALKLFIIFLVTFIWARYFIRNFWLASLISVIVTVVFELLSRVIHKKKFQREELKLQEKEDAENIFLSIATCDKPLDFFLKLAKVRHLDTIKKKNYIQINHDDEFVVALYPFLNFAPLDIDELAKILSSLKKDNIGRLVIVCGQYNKEAISFAKNFDFEIVILDKYSTYSSLYKEYNTYPEITLKYKKDKKLAMKDLVAYSFNRQRTKGYIFSALILFLSSMLIRPSLYYCIVASLLLVFALISFYNPYFNPKLSNEVL